MILGMQMCLFFFALFAIPVIVEVKTLLRLWLEKVPDQSDVFCRLMITGLLFETIRRVCLISIHATGRVKIVSLCIGILLTLNPFIVYLVFRALPVVSLAYVSNVFINMILALIIMVLVKKQIPEFSLRRLICLELSLLQVLGSKRIGIDDNRIPGSQGPSCKFGESASFCIDVDSPAGGRNIFLLPG